MLYKDLLKNDAVKNWLIEISEDDGTRRLYTYHLQYYTEFLHMTPEELLREAEDEIVTRVKIRESKLNHHLNEYKESMRKQFAPKTVKSRMTAVRSFYEYYGIPLPPKVRKEKRAKPLKENQEEPSKEDMQEVLRHCDELESCLILLGASAGLGAQEISLLTVRDFERGRDDKTGVTTLRLRREKAGYDFVTYLNPEATRAVIEYLEVRKRESKSNNEYHRKQLEKQRITKNSYLLIKRKVPNQYLETHDEELRRLTEDAIIEIYNGLAEKAGKSTAKGRWGLIRSHNVRKYFSTNLLESGVEKIKIDFMLGHTQSDSDTAYFHSIATTKLKDLYMNHMSCLSLTEAYDPDKDPSFAKLKETNNALTHVIKNMTNATESAREEIEELKTQLDIERAERAQYESNVNGMIDHLVDERMRTFRQQMEAGFNAMIEQMSKNLKQPPVDISRV